MLLATGIRDNIRYVVAGDTLIIALCISLLATHGIYSHAAVWVVVGVVFVIVAVLWVRVRWQPFAVSVTFIGGATSANILLVATANEWAGSVVGICCTLVVGVYVCVVHGWVLIGGYVLSQLAIAGVYIANSPEGSTLPATISVLAAFFFVNVTTCYIALFGRRAFAKYAKSSLESAKRDPLTQLLNRRGLLEAAESLLGEGSGGAPAHGYVAVADLDKFKVINDKYGHREGDRILQSVALALRVRVAASITARVGGEEFVMVNQSPYESPADFGKRICAELREISFLGARVTASVGVATLRHESKEPFVVQLESSIARADEAMYVAKRLGGDQVHFSSQN